MSVAVKPGSPHYVAAKRFADELNRAMRTRNIGRRRLALALGMKSDSIICAWRAGETLPRLESAQGVADALRWPLLAELVKLARTKRCARPGCQETFIEAAGGTQQYHDGGCQRMAEKLKLLTGRPAARIVAAGLERELERHKTQVSAMCRECEPAGSCRTPECALRPLSPLPLVREEERDTTVATPGPGPYGTPENRAKTIAAIREENAVRWSDPANRAEQSKRSHRFHDTMTPEQRSAWLTKMRAARRQKAMPPRELIGRLIAPGPLTQEGRCWWCGESFLGSLLLTADHRPECSYTIAVAYLKREPA